MAVSTNLPDHSLCPLFNSTVRLTDLSSFVSTFCQVSQHWPVPSLLFPFSSLQWSFFFWGSSADRHTGGQAIPYYVLFPLMSSSSSVSSSSAAHCRRQSIRVRGRRWGGYFFLYISFFSPVNHTINCLCGELLFLWTTTCVSQFVKQKKDAATFFRCWLSPLFSFFCLYHRFFFVNLSVFKPPEDVDHFLMRSMRCVLLCLSLSASSSLSALDIFVSLKWNVV